MAAVLKCGNKSGKVKFIVPKVEDSYSCNVAGLNAVRAAQPVSLIRLVLTFHNALNCLGR
jgi:hypothetical protein